MTAVRMSDFWRNLRPPAEPSQPAASDITTQKTGMGGNAPERADHLEYGHGAHTDLADVVAREEGLDAVK